MSIDFKFENHRKEFEQAMDVEIKKTLIEWGQAAQGFATTQCPVDTGRLKNSITYDTDFGKQEAMIGTNVEYAPRVEFDDKARHETGKAHFMRDAINRHQNVYKQIMENNMSELDEL